MSSFSQHVQSIISFEIPYVFIDKIKVSNSFANNTELSKDIETLKIQKNEFGNNDVQLDQDPEAKKYYNNDNIKIVKVDMILNDLLNDSLWYNDAAARDMKVRIIQSNHPDMTKRIFNENIKDISVIEDKYKKFLQQKDISIPTSQNLNEYRVKNLEEINDVLCSIPVSTSFICNSEHLTYFIFCWFSTKHGERTIERVLDGDLTSVNTSTYYLPNGTPWSGPVHVENGITMTGADTKSATKLVVAKREHLNVRINDYRVFDKIRKSVNDLQLSFAPTEKEKVFSELFLSRDKDKSAKGLFIFNYKESLLRYSKYNSILLNFPVENWFENANIDSIKVIRRRERQAFNQGYNNSDESRNYKVVSYSYENKATSLVKTKFNFSDTNGDGKLDKAIGSISEKKIKGLGNNKAFTFYDSEIKEHESGLYQYGVELDIKDPTISFMKKQLSMLEDSKKLMTEYYNTLNKKEYFDSNNKINYKAVDFLKDAYDLNNSLSVPPWRKSIAIFFRVLKNLTGQYDKNSESEITRIVSPVSRTLAGIEEYIALVSEIILKLPEKGATYDISKRYNVVATGKRDGNIKVTHFFNERFNSSRLSIYGMNYFDSYLENNVYGINSITPTKLLERFNEKAEVDKVSIPLNTNIEEYKKFYSSLKPTSLDVGGNAVSFRKGSKNVEFLKELVKIKTLLSKRGAKGTTSDIPQIATNLTDNSELNKTKAFHNFNSLAAHSGLKVEVDNPKLNILERIRNRQTKRDSVPETRLPAGENDSFNKNKRKTEANPFIQNARQNNDIIKSIDINKSLGVINGVKGDVQLEEDTSVIVQYVFDFDKNLVPKTVEAPFASSEPYLLIVKPKDGSKYFLNEHMNNSFILVDSSIPDSVEPNIPETNDITTPEEPAKEVAEQPVNVKSDPVDSSMDALYNRGHIGVLVGDTFI